jgi:xanthine/CO dehydrogenase XdhC/CoxF family maturation factor
MYDIASAVAQWQAAGQQVMVARVVEVHGLSSRNPAEAVATAAGSPLVGSVLSGASTAS